jgi:hypothetical protein
MWALDQLEFVNAKTIDHRQDVVKFMEPNEVQTCDNDR